MKSYQMIQNFHHFELRSKYLLKRVSLVDYGYLQAYQVYMSWNLQVVQVYMSLSSNLQAYMSLSWNLQVCMSLSLRQVYMSLSLQVCMSLSFDNMDSHHHLSFD
jgi:hypothetical protein